MNFHDFEKIDRKREVGFIVYENRTPRRSIIISRLQGGRYEAKCVEFIEYPSLKALVTDQHEKGFLYTVPHVLREEMKSK